MVADSTLESTPASGTTRSPQCRRWPLRLLVFVLFFISGALALVYEVAWVRAMTLQFGSTSLAVSTVLTVFMGGLALGA